MTDNTQKLEEFFQQQYERDLQIMEEVGENLKQVFTDEKQYEVVFDMYQQLYKLSNDVQELNRANIFMNSYIDAFHQLFVGEGKNVSEEEFRQASSDSYHASLQTILKANEQSTEESE